MFLLAFWRNDKKSTIQLKETIAKPKTGVKKKKKEKEKERRNRKEKKKKQMVQGSRTKHDLIVGASRATECGSGIIQGVRVSIWAQILEKFEVGRSTATISRSRTRTSATKLGIFENCTWMVASTGVPQLSGAQSINVTSTFDHFIASARRSFKFNRNIESINHGDIKETHVVDSLK